LGVEEAKHLEALPLQGVSNRRGIPHSVVERGNAVGIGVDTHDDSEAALESRPGLRRGHRAHAGWPSTG
jgi:hypothetical protein